MNLKTCSAFLLLSALTTVAQTINDFRTPAGGAYGVGTNWTLNAVPSSNDIARIGATASQSVNLTGGTYSAGSLLLVSPTNGSSLLNVTGGQLSFSSASSVGTNGTTGGIVNSGGTLLFSNGLTLATSTGSVTVGYLTNHSGQVRIEGNLQIANHIGGGGGARAYLTVNGGTVTVTGNVSTANAMANSFITLNGGALETAGFTSLGSATRREINFNGGILRGLQTQTNFIPTSANEAQFTNRVQNAGAVIDSQGFTLTVARPFLQDGTSTGGLRKLGTGILNLAGANTYMGGTIVSQGTVRIIPSGSLANNPTNRVVVSAGATFALARVNAITPNHSTVCQVPFIVNGGTLASEGVANRVQNITLNGGTVIANGGGDSTYGALYLAGTITVGGSNASLITNTTAANSFFPLFGGSQTTFDVSDATADPTADLVVYARLANLINTAGGGLRKNGAGTLLLEAANTYSGETTVANGVLALGAGGSFLSSTAITIAAGAVLDVTARTNLNLQALQTLQGYGTVTGGLQAFGTSRIFPGARQQPGTLTISGPVALNPNRALTLDLTNDTTIGSGLNDFVSIGGDLDAQGAVLRIQPLVPLANGAYTLINYAGGLITPFSNDVLGNTTRDAWTLDQGTTGLVLLNVTPGTPQDLLWNPVADGNWNQQTSNWVDWATGTVTDRFYDLDRVYFDERGALFNTVNLSGVLQADRLFVTGSSNYTFTGSGRLTDTLLGAAVLTKDGSGVLTIATTNSFSGGVWVSNGIAVAASASAWGLGPVRLAGGAIRIEAGLTIGNAVELMASTNVADSGAFSSTLGGTISGTGTLFKTGAGTITLFASNRYEGGTRIVAGTLRQTLSRSMGEGTIALGDPATGTNAVAYLFAGGTTPTNPVIVTAEGTGPVTLGTYSAGSFTAHGGPLLLNRPTLLTDATGDRTTFLGPISGSPGTIRIAGTRITFGNSSNSFTGQLVIPAGTIYQNDSTSALPYTASVTNDGTFRLNNGGTHLVSSLSGTGQVLIIAGGATTLQLGTGDVSSAYAGTISNGVSVLSLAKSGTGTVSLSGTLAFTGDTTIQQGTLRLSTALTGSSTIVIQPAGVLDVTPQPAFAIRAGQTVRGSGRVTGSLIAAPSARIVPGSGGPGGTRETLSIQGDVGLNPAATSFFNLVSATDVGGGTNDLILIQGALEPSNSVIRIDAEELLSTGTYTLITYTGAKTTSFRPNPALFGFPIGRKVATVDESVAGEIRLVVTGEHANLVWMPQADRLWNTTSANWSNSANGLIDNYFDRDTVAFTDDGLYAPTATVSGVLSPAAVNVSATGDYVIAGTGNLSGLMPLTKTGSGLLTLSTSNNFTGGVRIEAGVLRMGHSDALGVTSVTVVVTNTGTLDINGLNSGYAIRIAGSGRDGQGALVNQGAALANGPDYISLDGPAAIGGINRWDIRGTQTRLDLNGFTLTKTGTNYVPVVQGRVGSGTVEVVTGGFGVEVGAVFTAGQINVRSDAFLGLYNNASLTVPLTVEGGQIVVWDGSGSVLLQSPITISNLPLRLRADAGDALYLTNTIDGNAGLIIDGSRTGTVELASDTTFTGDVVMNGGTLTIGRGGLSGSLRGQVIMSNSATLYHWRSDGLTLTNRISGSGSLLVRNPVGLRLDGSAAIDITGDLQVPYNGFTNTIVIIDAGADVRSGQLLLGNQSGYVGVITQHAGQVVVNNSGNPVRIGHWGNEYSRYVMGGGLISCTNGRFVIGWDGNGALIQTGGVIRARRMQVDGNNATTGSSQWILEGGTVQLIDAIDAPGDASDMMYWGGGTVEAIGAWSMTAGARVQLTGTNGPTRLDTAGFSLTFTGNVFSGAGGLVKAGSGTLAFNANGTNSHLGETRVEAGTLALLGTLTASPLAVGSNALAVGTGRLAHVTVEAGGMLRPGYLGVASPMSATSLTLAAGSRFAPLNGGTASILRVTGTNAVTLPAGPETATLLFSGVTLGLGTFTLLDYAGVLQGGDVTNLVLDGLPPRVAAYVTNNSANTSIDLVVTDLGEPVLWIGAVDSLWDINTTTNWQTLSGGTPTAYLEELGSGDAVVFGDNASAAWTVQVATAVSPVGITIRNTNTAYAIAGAPIGGSSGIQKFGSGELELAGSNQFTGASRIEEGRLTIGSDAALGSPPAVATSNHLLLGVGATLRVTGSTVLAATRGVHIGPVSGSGSVTLDVPASITITSLNTWADRAGATGEVVKTGGGAWYLNAPNTFRGGLTVGGGDVWTIGAQAANRVFTGALIQVQAGARFLFAEINALGAADYRIDGGTLMITNRSGSGGYHAHVRNITLIGGQFIANGGPSPYNAEDVQLNGSITVTGSTPSIMRAQNGFGLSGTNRFNVHNVTSDEQADLTVTGQGLGGVLQQRDSGTNGLIKSGSGSMELIGTNTYLGGTTIEGGVLRIADNSKLYHGAYMGQAVVTVRSNAVLDLGTWSYSEPGNESLGGLRANNNAIVLDGGVIRMRRTTAYYRGFTIGSNGATLETGPDMTWTLNYTNTVPLVTSAGGPLRLQGTGTGDLRHVHSGTGSLSKAGSGRWILGATNTYSGPTTVEEGELVIRGVAGSLGAMTIQSNALVSGSGVIGSEVLQFGVINPGEGIGTLTVSNGLVGQSTALTRFELASTSQYDRLIVSGGHTLEGTLDVVLTNGLSPQIGDQFRIIDNLSSLLIPNVTLTQLPTLTNGMGWDLQYALDNLTLVVTGAPAPSVGSILGSVWQDVDGDGVVDSEDATNGISGVTVVLSGESQTNNTVTGVDGSYQFTNLIAGSYTITQIDLDGYASTMDRDGTNDNVVVIQLTAGETVTNVWYLDRKLSAYEVWAQTITNEAQRGDLMDADGDGYLNLWEYSQGTDATNSASNVKVWMGRTNGVMYVRFSRATGAVDVVYVVESGVGVSNGVVWEGVATNSLGLGWEGESSITESGTGSVRTVIAEDIDPAAPRRTMRVRVERP